MNRALLVILPAAFLAMGVIAQTKPLVPQEFGIQQTDFKTAWFEPEKGYAGRIQHMDLEFEPLKKDQVRKFQRMELGFNLPDDIDSEIAAFMAGREGINPFNPENIDVQVFFMSPSGEVKNQIGFYYKPFRALIQSNADEPDYKNEYVADTTSFPWRVRFAPDVEGQWNVSVKISVRNHPRLNYELGSFTCEASTHKGRLLVSQTGTDSDRYLTYSGSREPFFSIGLNVSSAVSGETHPSQINRWKRTLKKLSQVGGNFTRLEVGGQTGLPEWPVYNNYMEKLDDLFAFDQIIQTCEDNGIYFVLFRHHIEMRDGADWETVKWQNNPYKTGMNASPEDYFTKEEVIKWQNYSLRYLMARYCYSPNAAFYGYSELEGWYAKLEKDNEENRQNDGGSLTEADASKMLNGWIKKQQDYIRNELKNPILFCNTYASQASVIDGAETDANRLSDIVGIHLYNSTKNANLKRSEAVDKAWNTYKKPVFMEEMGVNDNFLLIQCCTDIEFHNSIWATAFMGSFGIGLDWWWDAGIFDLGYYRGFGPVHSFFMEEGMVSPRFKYLPQKWSDTGNWKKRKIESYTLVRDNSLKAMGWVHNATYYWRNLAATSPCIQNLLDEKTKQSEPCHCAHDESGSEKNPYTFPRRYIDMYEHENTKGYNYGKIPDAYTAEGAVPITSGKDNPVMKISGLKKSAWGKQKTWYRITFYDTRTGAEEPVNAPTQRVATNVLGQLKFPVPNMNKENPDYAYKIILLGEGTTPQNAEIRTK